MQLVSNGIPINIKLETSIVQNEHQQNFIYESVGQAVQVGNNWYIRYEEKAENGEQFQVMVKFCQDGSIHLTRQGAFRTKLRFVPGELTETAYQTPYGTMLLVTKTKQLQLEFSETPFRGQLKLVYELSTGEEIVGNYQLFLDFKA
ncbi:DUF1934 domain-containing protein [Enterococcus columbae]|uniref:DUF1934 domain-containing protein n=1 Tax=Enterococcus columbae DSM 7374 = ATCC 51263 TaxID=1121865 RepID=S1NEZ2_9ENTE|nr:DUF1934 domain-containing protein [Enterococcus columbae]EOT44945.1 hypothetical protein OMW_00131 [Enterococcus columbae DSM 7374 = ATCC 51263]EOW84238.1 hypothetical protein I568_00725 [Enterococcus columbae DSM 7374 = ATCC 51263]